MSIRQGNLRNKTGSIMVVAMIFATIAAVGIGSYLRLVAAEMRFANAQFYSNASLNLAEAGVEEALYAINRKAWSDEDWGPGPRLIDREKRFENIDLGAGATGEFIVRVLNFSGSNPMVIAEGRVFSSGRTVSKQIETALQKRTPFANGITSRNGIFLRGNRVFIASYLSSDPLGVLRDNGSIASVQVVDEAVDIGNAEIRGWVATGGGNPVWRNNATVGSFETPDGVVDEDRISKDFTSSFPDVEVPDPELIPLTYLGQNEIGDPLVPQYWTADSVHLSGNESEAQLRIRGHVTMIVENDFTMGGNGRVIIEEGASLTLYVGGDLGITGNGIANHPGTPRNLQIYGFGDGINNWSLGGTADLFAAVYAPNANVDIRGTSEFRGAVVGNQVMLNGNTYFLYDEDLTDLFTEERFAMASWRELYGSDRHSL
jgi:hypothetical protein